MSTDNNKLTTFFLFCENIQNKTTSGLVSAVIQCCMKMGKGGYIVW